MKRKTIFSLFVLFLITGCIPVNKPQVAEEASPLGFNMLIGQTGKVTLRREYQQKYYPITFGTFLKAGDLIFPESGTDVLIFCGNGETYTISKESGIPCKSKSPLYFYDNEIILRPRTNSSLKTLPYIIEPRSTAISKSSFLIRWNSTGSNQYHVFLYNTDDITGKKLIWDKNVENNSEVIFTDEDGLLDSKFVYWVEVVDDRKKSSRDDPTQSIGFRLLSQSEQKVVKSIEDQIDSVSISDSEKAMVLAAYYFNHELYVDAITQLNKVSNSFPAPIFWKARIFDTIGLPADDVKQQYLMALAEAGKAGDIEMQASVNAFLYRLTKERAYLEEAIKYYEMLNDKNMIDTLYKLK